MDDVLGGIGSYLIKLAAKHPAIAGGVAVAVGLAFLMVNGLRYAYPKYEKMPVVARFIIGFCDPITGNIWNILQALFPKKEEERLSESAIARIEAMTKGDGNAGRKTD